MAGQIPLWQRAAGPLRRQAARFPFERALVMGVAAVVGLYGGVAAGPFAPAIRSGPLVLFPGNRGATFPFGRAHPARLPLLPTPLAPPPRPPGVAPLAPPGAGGR